MPSECAMLYAISPTLLWNSPQLQQYLCVSRVSRHFVHDRTVDFVSFDQLTPSSKQHTRIRRATSVYYTPRTQHRYRTLNPSIVWIENEDRLSVSVINQLFICWQTALGRDVLCVLSSGLTICFPLIAWFVKIRWKWRDFSLLDTIYDFQTVCAQCVWERER